MKKISIVGLLAVSLFGCNNISSSSSLDTSSINNSSSLISTSSSSLSSSSSSESSSSSSEKEFNIIRHSISEKDFDDLELKNIHRKKDSRNLDDLELKKVFKTKQNNNSNRKNSVTFSSFAAICSATEKLTFTANVPSAVPSSVFPAPRESTRWYVPVAASGLRSKDNK